MIRALIHASSSIGGDRACTSPSRPRPHSPRPVPPPARLRTIDALALQIQQVDPGAAPVIDQSRPARPDHDTVADDNRPPCLSNPVTISALDQGISSAKGESKADDREPSVHRWSYCRKDRAQRNCLPSSHRSALWPGAEVGRRLGLPRCPQGVGHEIDTATSATQPPSPCTPGSAHRTASPGCHPNVVP